MIADEKHAVAAAGIMGGLASAVGEKTSGVLLESAFFAPGAVAGRARRLGLQTEASLRFERGVDPVRPGRGHRAGDRTDHRGGAAGSRGR